MTVPPSRATACGVGAEGAPGHDAVDALRRHVHDGGEVHVDAHRGELGRGDFCETGGIGLVPHGRVAGELGERRAEPRHLAALLVDGDEQGRQTAAAGARLCCAAQPGDLLRGGDVALEQDEAAHAQAGDQVLERRIHVGAVKAGHQALAGQLLVSPRAEFHCVQSP